MKDPFDALLGNERQKKFFRTEIEAGALAHAYILEGEQGTGRHTLALAVAAVLAGNERDSERILRGICPDVKTFGLLQDRKTFTVDLVRSLKEDAAVKPNDLSFRFYILENAERMNLQAQNAALKLLEEPPADTWFFLLCENAAALLPTVRSRAPVIRMQRFSKEELTELLLRTSRFAKMKEADEEGFDGAVKSSGGSYGKAVAALGRLSKNEKSDAEEIARRLLACLAPPNKTELLVTALTLPGKRPEFDEVLGLLQLAFRDMLLVRCGGEDRILLWFSTAQKAEDAAKGLTGKALLRLYDSVTLARENLEKNINIQNARMALVNQLYGAALN